MAKRLEELYVEKPNDKLVPLQDANGFTLVSDYPEGRDGKSIFLRLYLDEGLKLGGGANRVKSESDHGGHTILGNDDPKDRVTNFSFDKNEGFWFENEMVHHAKLKQPLTVSDFMDFLIRNHTSDKLGSIRRKQFLNKILLNVSFWLVDLHYKNLKLYDLEGSLKTIVEEREKNKQKEPFLKYFDIPKNMFITVMLFLTILSVLYFFTKSYFQLSVKIPDVTNPYMVLYVATAFIVMDKIASLVNGSIQSLDKNLSGWVGGMIAEQFGFNQKIKLDFGVVSK